MLLQSYKQFYDTIHYKNINTYLYFDNLSHF